MDEGRRSTHVPDSPRSKVVEKLPSVTLISSSSQTSNTGETQHRPMPLKVEGPRTVQSHCGPRSLKNCMAIALISLSSRTSGTTGETQHRPMPFSSHTLAPNFVTERPGIRCTCPRKVPFWDGCVCVDGGTSGATTSYGRSRRATPTNVRRNFAKAGAKTSQTQT